MDIRKYFKENDMDVNDIVIKEEDILADNIASTTLITNKVRGFEIVRDECRKFPDVDVKLPQRGTSDSMAYDFYSNETVTIMPGEQYMFVTDIKAYMQPGEALIGNVRSSQGVKKHLSFANSQAWIDMDYYSNPSNDGSIGVCLYNYGTEPQTIEIGERIAQFAFIPFLVADNGNTDNKRIGGFGSTNKEGAK